MGNALERMRIQRQFRALKSWGAKAAHCFVIVLLAATVVSGQSGKSSAKKGVWQSIQFGILRYNDSAPNSWNIYHGEKKGVLLVRLWKRYLLVNVQDEEVYDIDPQTVKVQGTGETVEWSLSERPDTPIETPEFKEKNSGPVELIHFRLGKDGHVLELQIPNDVTGRPVY